MTTTCIFYEITQDKTPATVVRSWTDALAIVPLDAVTDGHVLVIPNTYVKDFTTDPVVSAAVMPRAAELAASIPGDWNLITSRGRSATQSIYHLHLHLIPRKVDDGLALPWYNGRGGHSPKEPTCRCGHTWDQHLHGIDAGCAVCPEDGEGVWLHLFTPEEPNA